METVEFPDVEVLDDSGATLLCLIADRRVPVPSLYLQPGTGIRRGGDRGNLVIPRWLGIGLGLVWPFSPATREPRRDPVPVGGAKEKLGPRRDAGRLDAGSRRAGARGQSSA